MKKTGMKNIFFLIIISLLFIYPSTADASGLESKGIGARARGMGFAMIAVTGDWSAIYYNPASAGMFDENTFGIEYEYFSGSIDSSESLRNLSINDANSARGDFIDFIGDEPFAFTKKNIDSDIHFGALGCIFKREKFSYGIGLYGSGSGTTWKDEMLSHTGDPLKGEVSFVNGALNIPMILSYRFLPELSLGFTLGFHWGLLKYKTQKIRTGNIPYTFKTVHNTDGIGINTDVGLLWKATENVNIGIVLKFPYTFKKTGETHIEQSLSEINVSSDTTIYMHYPFRTSLGFAWQITDKTLFASSITWLNWNKYNLKIDYANDIPGIFDDYKGNPGDWMNTVVVNVGLEHQLTDKWKIRGGITYDQAPEPESSRILTGGQVVDAWLFSLGAGVELGKMVINFGYIYTYGPEVEGFIPGAVYSLNLHEMFLGIVMHF